MPTQKDYTSNYKPTWCPGCGNFSISPATKKAFSDLNLDTHKIMMSFGIGCSSNGANFYNLYSVHGIHGRALPVAVGVKLANQEMTVLADSGDGDAYGEGLSHFISTARSDVNITYLVHDNHLYSLTKGQMSPTSLRGMKTKSTPFGSLNEPFNPLATAIINGATFVAQGFSGDIAHLTELIKLGIQHKGFALINILQICPTFNKFNTFDWYKERTFHVEDVQHDKNDKDKAIDLVTKDDEKLPLGVIYQADKPTFGEQLPQIEDETLVKQSIENIDISESLENYK
ncbi:MAG: 2-oxoacid:ferredoxin oxidoreductase subunit beta [Candidatus Kerfeldbacteria bacterium]|jgi:2-oxoglutarate/2-oxoacid ferredoxin oxidoreductase subunit beta